MLPFVSTLLVLTSAVAAGQVNVLTYHNTRVRTGVNTKETVLTTGNVKSATFGKLFVIAADGKVDAQPLYASSVVMGALGTRNVLYVATEHDSVYAFDADTGLTLWHASALLPGETTSDIRGCGQVVPEIGITSTPVIVPQMGAHGTIYVVAMSKDSQQKYYQRLHALDMTTGTEQFGGPVTVQASYPGTGDNSINGSVVFDAKMYKDRAALLFLNGEIYTMWSSHCDIRPYTGWVIRYHASTLKQSGVLNLTPNGHDGAIWESGAGPAADATDPQGNVYWLEANGTFDTKLTASGLPSQGDYGNAFVKMSTTGTLQVADYFTMFDTATESGADQDLGSGGAILLPPLKDSHGATRSLAVGAGKDQKIYVVDRNNLGKFSVTGNNVFQEIDGALAGQVFSTPAFFNGVLYYGASGDVLKAFRFSGGHFAGTPSSQSAVVFPYPGATPSISSNGLTNVIVWAARNGGAAALYAYDGTDLTKELYDSNQAPGGRDNFGTGNKFIVPTIANGKVYVGTTSGVGVFGLLP